MMGGVLIRLARHGATGDAVGRPKVDDHQEGGDEAEHRRHHQGGNASALRSSHDGGDEDQDGAQRVMEELRQRPVDAAHPALQPAQVHEEEDEEGHQEPERHHLEELEGVPAGPAAGQTDTQEDDEEGEQLADLQQSRDGPAVAQVEGAVPGGADGAGRDDGVGHDGGGGTAGSGAGFREVSPQ